jgi:WXXGXW repeat (2 copies)
MTRFTKRRLGLLVAPVAAALLGVGCTDNQHVVERTTTIDPPNAPPTVTRERTVVDPPSTPPLVTRDRTVTVNPPTPPPTVTRERIVVVEAPPAAREEVIPAPREGFMWVRGHYRHDGKNYYWVPGKYEPVPRPGARYIPGHWETTTGGYMWIEGRWD